MFQENKGTPVQTRVFAELVKAGITEVAVVGYNDDSSMMIAAIPGTKNIHIKNEITNVVGAEKALWAVIKLNNLAYISLTHLSQGMFLGGVASSYENRFEGAQVAIVPRTRAFEEGIYNLSTMLTDDIELLSH